ncbi:MAG TPA: hypothetical protein VI454_04415 [Verrucomicrobiae bacterium]|jgi:hypothetical protein
MKFTIEIGHKEKHQLQYQFNQLLGRLVIKIDNQLVKESVRLFNEPVLEVHVLLIGESEKSAVRIEKQRKALFGQRNRLYVNDRLAEVFDGV